MRLYQIFLAKMFGHFRRHRDPPAFYFLLLLCVNQLTFFGLIAFSVISIFLDRMPQWICVCIVVLTILFCVAWNFVRYISRGRIYELEARYEQVKIHPFLVGMLVVISWPLSMVFGAAIAVLIPYILGTLRHLIFPG